MKAEIHRPAVKHVVSLALRRELGPSSWHGPTSQFPQVFGISEYNVDVNRDRCMGVQRGPLVSVVLKPDGVSGIDSRVDAENVDLMLLRPLH